jgi:hypothetical protein
MSTDPTGSDPTALRGEHDALAEQLAARRSVDHVRRGAYVGFAALIGVGLSVKLAWDRWGPPRAGVVKKLPHGLPLFFILAIVATLVLAIVAGRALRRAGALRREEDALFTRLRALRVALGLDG